MKGIIPMAMCGALSLTLMTSCGAESSDKPQETTSQRYVAEYDASKPVIALTFDDGPSATTRSVLEKLKKYNAVASFFVVGSNINDDTAKTISDAYNMGCEINNHSKTHAYMNKQTAEQIIEEIGFTSRKVEEITGEAPRFFRPPYIAVNDTMFENIELPFIAGFGCEDWNKAVTAEQRVESVLGQARDGAIILMHDSQGNFNTVTAIGKIIPELQSRGYQLVTVSQLFEAKGTTPKKKIIYSYADQTSMYG